MNEYIAQWLTLIGGFKVLAVTILIFLDFVMGVVLAIAAKQFDWHKLASFLDTGVIKILGGYLAVGAVAEICSVAFPSFYTVFSGSMVATWAIIVLKVISDVITKLQSFGVVIQPPPASPGN